MSAQCSSQTSAPGLARPAASAPTPRSATGPRAALAWARRALRVAGQRRELAALEARQMADLGLTEEARRAELARPFWDID